MSDESNSNQEKVLKPVRKVVKRRRSTLGPKVIRLARSPRITNLALSPDGNVLAIVRNKRRLRIVDTQTESEITRFELLCPVEDICFSPDGTTVALVGVDSDDGNRAEATYWEFRSKPPKDLCTDTPYLPLGPTPSQIAFDSSGNRLAINWDGFRILELPGGRITKRLPQKAWSRRFCLTPNGVSAHQGHD